MASKISLPVRLGVLVAGTLLPLIIFAGVIVYQHHIERREETFSRVLQLVRSTRLILDSEVNAMTAGLQVLALSAALQRDDFEQFRRNAESFLSQFPEKHSIVIGDREGRLVFDTRPTPGTATPTRTTRLGTGDVFKTRRPAYSPLFTGTVSKEILITITVPVFRDAEVIYDLSFNPSLAEFQRIIERQRPNEDWTLSFFDQTGVVIARLPNPESAVGQPASPAFYAQITKVPEAKIASVSREGLPLLTAFTRSDVTGWTVAAGIAEETLTAPLWRQLMLTAAIGTVLLLIGLAFAVRLATRLARAEAMQSLLVDELNHRVKNTLQTVQSIAAQTFRHARDIPDALQKFDGRVVAMGRANELLSEERWRNADMADLVDSALEPFRSKDRQRLHASGPNLSVAPQSAVMISMMLHELATNAAKYGALSNDTGEVFVDWRELGENGGRRVQLTWRETGGPSIAAVPERKGFGTTLIQRGLTAQSGGKADIEFAPDGLRCTLECPVR
ncbi:MAG TPA: sensor histidine kinase [Xanthobacteraceae bacterium]|nr:sensor histidine kinase [Xanthobacteraceae bacterium]